MSIFLYNFSWMSLNILLAIVGVILAYSFLKVKNKTLKALCFILWILFLPNTIYLLTDVQYIPEQFGQVNNLFKIFILLQYVLLVVLGVITFVIALKPMRIVLKSIFKKNKSFQVLLIILVNFIISFGVVLGKFERIHSWYVVTDPGRVLADSMNVLTSFRLMSYVLLFGILANFVYFIFRKIQSK